MPPPLAWPDEHVQALLLFGTLFGGLFSLLTLTLGVLCYFLRYLITVTIPGMVQNFREELTAERASCHADHEQLMRTILDKHEDVLFELRKRP